MKCDNLTRVLDKYQDRAAGVHWQCAAQRRDSITDRHAATRRRLWMHAPLKAAGVRQEQLAVSERVRDVEIRVEVAHLLEDININKSITYNNHKIEILADPIDESFKFN